MSLGLLRRANALVLAILVLGATACVQPNNPTLSQVSPMVKSDINVLAVDDDGQVRWNDQAITMNELAQLLADTKRLPNEPSLQAVLSPNAPYDVSTQMLRVIKASEISRFGFVGNGE